MDDLGKLLLFRDVVEQGGFSKAAVHRRLTHSTVSKHLKSLEADLGVVLLQRTSRSMTLTEEGRLVYDYSRRVGSHITELMERLDESRGEVRGELKVNAHVHVGRHLVQPAVERFLSEHPQARVELVLDDGQLQFTRSGLDLAVRVGLDVEGSLTAVKLITNEVCLAAAPGFLDRHGRPQHPSELTRYPAVAYASQSAEITTWTYLEGEAYKTVEIHPIYRVNEGNALLDAVRAGIGIGYLSTFAAQDDLRGGRLERVLLGFDLPPYEPVYVIKARSSYAAPKLEAFEGHLRAVARQLQ